MSFTAKKEEIKIDGVMHDICYDNGVIMDFEDEYNEEITKTIGKMIISEGTDLSSNIKLLSVMIRPKDGDMGIGRKAMRKLSPIIYDEGLVEKMMLVIMANVPKTDDEKKNE